MFEDYVTPEVFRDGLKIYFTKHAYSNTAKEDLWNAIAENRRQEGEGAAQGGHLLDRERGLPDHIC